MPITASNAISASFSLLFDGALPPYAPPTAWWAWLSLIPLFVTVIIFGVSLLPNAVNMVLDNIPREDKA